MADIPDPRIVLADLSPIFGVFYESLEHGAHKAKEIHLREIGDGEPICPYWGSQTLRMFSKRKLIALGQAVTDEDADHEIATETLPLNGLCLTYGKYRLRILKSSGDSLPVPSSEDRIAFYCQQTSLFNSAGAAAPAKSINLVVTWDVDANYNLNPLWLVMPERGGRTRDSIAVYWRQPIPYPDSLGGKVAERETTPPANDLPFGLKEKAGEQDSDD